MSDLVNVYTSFQRYNLVEKILNCGLTHTDFLQIQAILSLHLIYLKSIFNRQTEPNQTWDSKDTLIAAQLIRLHHLFNLLTYLSITLFGTSRRITYPKTDYIVKLNFSNPCRKEILVNFISIAMHTLKNWPQHHHDYESTRHLYLNFGFIQDIFEVILEKYIFKENTIQSTKLLAYNGEIKFYTTNSNIHFLELDGMSKRTVFRNLTIVGTTELKFTPYPRFWDRNSEEYDPNHFFSQLQE